MILLPGARNLLPFAATFAFSLLAVADRAVPVWAWAAFPRGNFYNRGGRQMSPFRKGDRSEVRDRAAGEADFSNTKKR